MTDKQEAANLPAVETGLRGDLDLLGELRPRVLTSLRTDTFDGLERFRRSLESVNVSGRDGAGMLFEVQDFIMRTTQRRRLDDGEVESCVQLILIAPDGSTYATTSEWCIRSFQEVCAFGGYPPWSPARVLEVRRVKTRGGFETYRLFEVIENKEKTNDEQ